MSRIRNDQISPPPVARSGLTVSTLIEQQMKTVSHLQGYAGFGDNGSSETREYAVALCTAIDKLATLEGLRHDKEEWRLLRQKEEEWARRDRLRFEREDAGSD